MIDTLFMILSSRELNCVLKPKKLLVKLKRNNEIHQGEVFCIPLVCSLGLQNALHDHFKDLFLERIVVPVKRVTSPVKQVFS